MQGIRQIMAGPAFFDPALGTFLIFKTLQDIHVYSLPEQLTQVQDQADLQGLYVVGNYQGKELQIDDYSLSYEQGASGVKTVTVDCQGKQDSFEMLLFSAKENNVLSFDCEEDLNGKFVMIAVYNENGAMITSKNAIIFDGKAQIGVSDKVYQTADRVKMFVLDINTYRPVTDVREFEV